MIDAEMRILIAPDPILSAVALPVGDDELPAIAELARQMAQVMYVAGGRGLAAPQVGVSKRVVVFVSDGGENPEGEPCVLVNPKVHEVGDVLVKDYEGCLSVPGVDVLIPRYETISLSYLDLDGNEQLLDAKGFAARCLQHELDHLDGKTLLDIPKGLAKLKVLTAYRAALKQEAAPGSQSIYQVG